MDKAKYLNTGKYINWDHPDVLQQAHLLAKDKKTDTEIAKACFEFVRDEIKHSLDFRLNPVTCIASDVLKYGTGYCYAKSHLLAALLRANRVPAGLCYQRLTITDVPPFCLHGLNAVYLREFGWYRIDARGNKEGVNAQFTPPIEHLAFPIRIQGEVDLPEIWSEPLNVVTDSLEFNTSFLQVSENLPDVDLIKLNEYGYPYSLLSMAY